MIHVQFFAVCDNIVVNPATGNSQINGLIDWLAQDSYPAVAPNFCIATRLFVENEQYCDMSFQFLQPNGDAATSAPQRVTAVGNIVGYIQPVLGFPLTSPGTYIFRLIIAGKVIAEYRVGAITQLESQIFANAAAGAPAQTH